MASLPEEHSVTFRVKVPWAILWWRVLDGAAFGLGAVGVIVAVGLAFSWWVGWMA